MELHQLRYMVKLAKHLHFSKAALELGITQPTLSQQIERLETELGCKLFARRTRSVELTLAGDAFLLHAVRVLDELAALSDTLQTYATPKKRIIRLGTFTNLSRFKLARHFLAFESSHPDVALHLVEKVGSCELADLLKAGRIDAAFLMPDPNLDLPEGIIAHSLFTGQLVVVCPKNHPLAQTKSASLHDVARERLIFPSRLLSNYGVTLSAFKAAGLVPNIACESNLTDSIIDLVSQGFGIALISSQFADFAPHPELAIVPLRPSIERSIAFVYQPNNQQAATLDDFYRFMLDRTERT